MSLNASPRKRYAAVDKRYQIWSDERVKQLVRDKTMFDMNPEEILQVVAFALKGNKEERSPELLMAIEEICLWVREFATQAQLSPRRAEFLDEFCKPLSNVHSAVSCTTISDTSVTRIRLTIEAQWAARKGGLATPMGRAAFEEGTIAFVNRYFRKGHGRDRVRDRLGIPSGRLLCAIGALCLIEVIRGGKGRSRLSSIIQRLCALIWTHAGGPPTRGQQGTDNSDEAWARFIRDAKKEIADPGSEGRILINEILSRHGLATRQLNPRELAYFERPAQHAHKRGGARPLGLVISRQQAVALGPANR